MSWRFIGSRRYEVAWRLGHSATICRWCTRAIPGLLAALFLLVPACSWDQPAAPEAPPEPSSVVPPAMRAWFQARGVTLPQEPPARSHGASKALAGEILGDGDGDGDADYWDLWVLWHHCLNFPWVAKYYNLNLLDIDRDGDADWDDLAIMGRYLFGVPKPANTYGIGETLRVPIVASLSPSPEQTAFTDDESWHRFILTVQTETEQATDERVKVIANPPGSTVALEIASGNNQPSRSYCGAESNDTRRNLGNGAVIWLSGCAPGSTSVVIEDEEGEELAAYEVTIDQAVDSPFDIELVYVDHFTATQKQKIEAASIRWETIITEDVPTGRNGGTGAVRPVCEPAVGWHALGYPDLLSLYGGARCRVGLGANERRRARERSASGPGASVRASART